MLYNLMLISNNLLAIGEVLSLPIFFSILTRPLAYDYPLLLAYLAGAAVIWLLSLVRAWALLRRDGLSSTSLLYLNVNLILGLVTGFYVISFLVYTSDMFLALLISFGIIAATGVMLARQIIQDDVKEANQKTWEAGLKRHQ